ncbi:MAG: LutC/YkgG family protein [Micromonosporaceae bacterium]
MTGDARAEVLSRIRAALGASPDAPPVPRDYRERGDHGPGSDALLDLLDECLVDYRARVRRVSAAEVGAAVDSVLAGHGARRVVLPPGLPDEWKPRRPGAGTRPAPGAGGPDPVELFVDDGMGTADLDQMDGVVTGCAVAIAETGTLVLDASPDQGRRSLTLIPDLHVCVVTPERVVQTVPEAVARLEPTRPLTFISGPSATSDIELDRVEGVHGPRRLEVLLVQA